MVLQAVISMIGIPAVPPLPPVPNRPGFAKVPVVTCQGQQ
jgi:hypothetical protein